MERQVGFSAEKILASNTSGKMATLKILHFLLFWFGTKVVGFEWVTSAMKSLSP